MCDREWALAWCPRVKGTRDGYDAEVGGGVARGGCASAAVSAAQLGYLLEGIDWRNPGRSADARRPFQLPSKCPESLRTRFRAQISGLQHLLVALQGPSWREQPEDADQRQPDRDRPRGARTRGVVTDKPTFSSISLPISTASAKITYSLQAHRLRTSRHTGLTLVPYRAFLHESGSYPYRMSEAVRQRKRAGLRVEPELLAHISLLGCAHILLTGEYRWPRKW